MAINEFAIAVGYNQTITTSEYVENLTPTGAVSNWLMRAPHNSYYYVDGLGLYDEPMVETDGGTVARNGFELVYWDLFMMASESYHDFYETYFRDSTQLGKVTIRTTLRANDNAYSNKNAVLFAPPPLQLQRVKVQQMTYEVARLRFSIRGNAS